ncbi:MAG: chromosomal replication initiator DnaA [Hyphomonas sp.]
MTPSPPGSPEGPGQPLLGFPAAEPDWDALVIGAPNQAAVSLAGRPDAWATHTLCITGPRFAGLSFLGAAWAARSGGQYLPAARFIAMKRSALDALAGGAVALDDADLIAAKKDDLLLSLYNMVGVQGGRLLLLAHAAPSAWQAGSADLRSRLNALPVAEISSPDEAHLSARLQAAAAARFMKLSRETVSYLVPRLDLSYEAVETVMDRLSGAVSRSGRPPGLTLARSVLEGLDEDGKEDEGAG